MRVYNVISLKAGSSLEYTTNDAMGSKFTSHEYFTQQVEAVNAFINPPSIFLLNVDQRSQLSTVRQHMLMAVDECEGVAESLENYKFDINELGSLLPNDNELIFDKAEVILQTPVEMYVTTKLIREYKFLHVGMYSYLGRELKAYESILNEVNDNNEFEKCTHLDKCKQSVGLVLEKMIDFNQSLPKTASENTKTVLTTCETNEELRQLILKKQSDGALP